MKKYGFYLMMFVIACFTMTSCKEEKENHKEKWMITNQGAITSLKYNAEYTELQSPGNEGSIYYKVLKTGDGTTPIYYTSSIGCYYKGWFIADYQEYNIRSGDKFDQQLFDDGPPAYFSVSGGLIAGWKTALQHMVKGDKWEIWVPYQLGYGRNDYQSSSSSPIIPGFSTLVFELEITNVVSN